MRKTMLLIALLPTSSLLAQMSPSPSPNQAPSPWPSSSPAPELLRVFATDGGHCAVFSVSGTLQPGDSQYVHDVFARETGEKLGTVRMRWAYKYGSRYGGCGYIGEGVSADYASPGLVRVCIPESHAPVREIVVVPRLAPIQDR